MHRPARKAFVMNGAVSVPIQSGSKEKAVSFMIMPPAKCGCVVESCDFLRRVGVDVNVIGLILAWSDEHISLGSGDHLHRGAI